MNRRVRRPHGLRYCCNQRSQEVADARVRAGDFAGGTFRGQPLG